MSIQTDLAVQERENEFHIDQVLALLDERDGQEALSDTQLIEFVYLAAVAYGLVCDLDLIPKLVSLYELFGPCDLVAVATKVEALVVLVGLQGFSDLGGDCISLGRLAGLRPLFQPLCEGSIGQVVANGLA